MGVPRQPISLPDVLTSLADLDSRSRIWRRETGIAVGGSLLQVLGLVFPILLGCVGVFRFSWDSPAISDLSTTDRLVGRHGRKGSCAGVRHDRFTKNVSSQKRLRRNTL